MPDNKAGMEVVCPVCNQHITIPSSRKVVPPPPPQADRKPVAPKPPNPPPARPASTPTSAKPSPTPPAPPKDRSPASSAAAKQGPPPLHKKEVGSRSGPKKEAAPAKAGDPSPKSENNPAKPDEPPSRPQTRAKSTAGESTVKSPTRPPGPPPLKREATSAKKAAVPLNNSPTPKKQTASSATTQPPPPRNRETKSEQKVPDTKPRPTPAPPKPPQKSASGRDENRDKSKPTIPVVPLTPAMEVEAPPLAGSDPAEVVRGVEHDPGKKWTVYQMGACLAVLGLVGMYPAIMEVVRHLRQFDSHGIESWAWLVFLITGIQIVYACYLVQLPDWSTTRVVMVISAVESVIYAMFMGIALMAKDENAIISAIGLETHQAAGYVSLWCCMMTMLMSLLTYFLIRTSLRWQKAYELATAGQ